MAYAPPYPCYKEITRNWYLGMLQNVLLFSICMKISFHSHSYTRKFVLYHEKEIEIP
jgi:nicotinamide riboside transporter PnuC